MDFRITGLSPEPFKHLFGFSDDELARHGAQRIVADTKPGYPDRIEVRDAEPGQSLLLVNYTHQPADTPYRASHAVFVREGATEPYSRTNEIPEAFGGRTISLRAFGTDHFMIDADLATGPAVEALIRRFLANPDVAYIQAHYAKRGCYAARIERA